MFQGSGGFGGGFNDQSFGGGGFDNKQASPGSKNRGGNQGKCETLMPVTVAMILKSTHDTASDTFRYQDNEIHLVTFIGKVRDCTEASTSITYKVDDGTGPAIDARKFITEGEEDTNAPQGNGYVKVIGHVRSYNDVRNIIAFSVQPVTDHNAITCHMLDVVAAQLVLKKGGAVPGNNAGTFNAGVVGSAVVAAGDSNLSGLTLQQQQVYQALKGSTADIGMSFTELAGSLQMSMAQIKQAVEFLSNEGHIYSTVDDDHFKLTDSC